MNVYNENRDKNLSMHDEIREQNAKLKNASPKEKWEYFKDYYLKTTLITMAAIILIGSIVYTMVTAPRDTAFAALFFNDTGDSSDTSLQDSFIEYCGIDTSEHYAYIDATYTYSSESMDYESGYVGLEKSLALIASKELDVIIGDQEAFDYYAKSETFHNITDILSDELLERFKDQIYYYTNEETGETLPLGIYVTDSPKLNQYHYYDEKEPIIGFIVNSDSIDNAIAFFEFIYMTE